ncbi:putative kinesin [Acephala macrosclerotiorum]|nr:putative kinesin [Acephala macrosclerotiorum]
MASISFGSNNSGLEAGTINGPVNTEFHHHAPPERPETPANPSIVIPFSRDVDFVERGAVLDQIHQKCAISGSRTALVGLGGVGKSQLAIEYAYRTRDRSVETWVFWVHASNAARFEQSFRDIANCVKIPGRQNLQANIFQLVHDWLRNDRKGKWVLILDNVDDAEFLVKAQSTGQDKQTDNISSGNLRPLVAYLPQCPNGSILITTRSKSAALKLVEQRDIIAVEPMDRAGALALFENKLGRHDDGDDTAELAAALEFMPLAIVQAAAYIFQRAPRYSVREYLLDFQKSDRKRTSLLNYEGEQLRRDQEAKNSIIITWRISFDYIRKVRPSATDLLSLMSFFDRQGIPEALLRSRSEQRNSRQGQEESSDDDYDNLDTGYSDDDKDNASQSSVSEGFEDDVLILRNYSFISVNTDGTTFEMHRLVQLATREWLKAHEQQERWKQQFIKNLDAELPTGEYENWVRCQTLFPHAQSAIAQQPEEEDSLRDWASILYKAAWYAWEVGKGVEAEKMSIQAMKVRKRILGREHNDTLWSMAMVGLVYKFRGRWDAAEELELQVIESRKKKLGADHLDTLISMGNLASTYRHQGRWDAAKELQLQVMETHKKKLGADHPNTLTSMNNLASTYRDQGRWDAAEELELQVMETRKKKLGADHPDTLMSMNNLAFTWKETGRETEAIRLMGECIQSRKRVLGLDHPYTISSCRALRATHLEGAAETFWQ